MTESLTASALAYYSAHGAALFPIPAGSKNPTGIVQSFKHDHSKDPAQWAAWSTANPGCNWGVVAFASNWIIVDTDVAEGRDAAWAARCALFAEWGVSAQAMPHVQSARGGWHDYFLLPDGVDASLLRQPDAIKGLINIRCRGYTVAAGSYYDGTAKGKASGPYLILSNAPPHPAPASLIALCTPAKRTVSPRQQGTRDRGDVAALIKWLAERDAFADYESWFQLGMSLKLEFGDSGLELWQLSHDDTVTTDVEATKWDSFATDPTAQSVTLLSFLDRAQKLGWRGSVRKSTSALFDGVAAIAAASGANLHGAAPSPAGGGLPMIAGQEVLAELGRPILDEFLAATADAPPRPLAADYPDLPASASGHGLYSPLRECVARIVAMAETKAKMSRTTDALAVLSLVHQDVFESVSRRCTALGSPVPSRRIKLAATSLADKVERAFIQQDDWQYDAKGFIENDNSDNMAVFLGIVGAEIRWNAWLERAELRGFEGEFSEWTYIDDTIVAKLRTRGNRTKTRFRPGKDFFWESLLALAHINMHDPVIDMLDKLAGEWDGVSRLNTWLTQTCAVPCDPYHQAVARNIIGGMVRRVRNPGCKHDTMAVLYGPQGTGKSTLARIVALNDDWFSDSIMFGDASKELVLSLAGKLVVEISEMGTRGNTNATHVKAMVSRQADEGRTAYARSVTNRKRRNCFIGTTNDDEPLTDPTGNRRFLPVHVKHEIDLAWLQQHIGQLVGEAAVKEAAGETFELPRSVWGDAAERQEAARAESDVETMLSDWFASTEYTNKAYILGADLVHLCGLSGWRNGGHSATRGAIMRRHGFTYENVIFNGKRTRAWVRVSAGTGPAEAIRTGTRYLVGSDSSGRPIVTIRHGEL